MHTQKALGSMVLFRACDSFFVGGENCPTHVCEPLRADEAARVHAGSSSDVRHVASDARSNKKTEFLGQLSFSSCSRVGHDVLSRLKGAGGKFNASATLQTGMPRELLEKTLGRPHS